MSALSRIALDDHRDVHLEPGDLVVLSARRIPGNEKSITRLVNHLCRRGANVMLDDMPGIHVSGHASREELKIMLALTRPKFFIPVHGDFQHLSQHAQLAEDSGIPKENVLVIESGDMVSLTSDAAVVQAKAAPVGSVFIDGTLEEVDQIVIRDRQHIAEDGIVIPVVVINKRSGTIEHAPEIISRGFVWVDNEEALFQEAGQIVVRAIESSSLEERSDWAFMKTKVHGELKRYFRRKTQRRPMIIPVIMEV